MSWKQRLFQWILDMFGNLYLVIVRRVEYPDDNIILGMKVDKDLQDMTRKQLCSYMDRELPRRGFYELQSTTKIRLGCQLVRKYNKLRQHHNNLIRKVRNDSKRNSK